MNNYVITFINENGKTKTIKVKTSGIIPAIEKALRVMIGKSWNVGHFWVPFKAEGLDVKKSI